MAYSVPARQETLEDQRLYTQARLTEIACLDCTVRVGVKKNSEHHTSVQWGPHGQDLCPEFNRLNQAAGGRAISTPCGRLFNSIDRAVRDGELTIGAEDGY